MRVLEGTVLDVAVDLRPGSSTFGRHVAVELSAENKKQLMIPRGFGHGFSVLTPSAVFAYKCDWKIDTDKAVLSEKDRHNPLLKEITCI